MEVDKMANPYIARCIELAELSPCLRMHFGCVIVKDGEIIAEGYNYPVLGQCKDSCIRDELNIPHGTHLETCWAVHAEQMALLRAGPKAKGADLYIVGVKPDGKILWRDSMKFYCSVCARLIINAGIKRLYGLSKDGVISGTPAEAMMFAMEVAMGKRGFND